MDKLEAMRTYMRVAELASFTRAADSLGLPKASVSTSVQKLENLLGTRLLHRTTRRVQMTQDGQVFYERCKDMLGDMDELESLFRQTPDSLHGRLRVDMPTVVAREVVMPRLPDFLARHPHVRIELSSTDRRVDLVEEGFDCVVRAGTLQESDLIVRPLGMLPMVNLASPAYIERHGAPESIADLVHHFAVGYAPRLGSRPDGFEYTDAGQRRWAEIGIVLTVNNVDAYQQACLAGLGIIQVPRAGVRALLAQGRLVEVLPQVGAAPLPLSLLYPNRRHLARRAQVFMDWLAGLLKDDYAEQAG